MNLGMWKKENMNEQIDEGIYEKVNLWKLDQKRMNTWRNMQKKEKCLNEKEKKNVKERKQKKFTSLQRKFWRMKSKKERV